MAIVNSTAMNIEVHFSFQYMLGTGISASYVESLWIEEPEGLSPWGRKESDMTE